MEKKSEAYEELVENYMKFNSCPVAATMGVIGGKWKPIILYLISHDVNRFGEMLRMIEGISKKMLTAQLRELEADGIINRKVFAEVPPRVEYSISDKGRSLQPLIVAMREWGLNHALQ
ncbi:MAG: helix-turn-helix domain-containing protein [Bacteroidota bacterium]